MAEIKPNRVQRRTEEHAKRKRTDKPQPQWYSKYVPPPAGWTGNNKKRSKQYD